MFPVMDSKVPYLLPGQSTILTHEAFTKKVVADSMTMGKLSLHHEKRSGRRFVQRNNQTTIYCSLFAL